MDVLIVETKTGKVVATIPVVQGGLNYSPSEQEYFSTAWNCAVEDGVVNAKQKASYTFNLESPSKAG